MSAVISLYIMYGINKFIFHSFKYKHYKSFFCSSNVPFYCQNIELFIFVSFIGHMYIHTHICSMYVYSDNILFIFEGHFCFYSGFVLFEIFAKLFNFISFSLFCYSSRWLFIHYVKMLTHTHTLKLSVKTSFVKMLSHNFKLSIKCPFALPSYYEQKIPKIKKYFWEKAR